MVIMVAIAIWVCTCNTLFITYLIFLSNYRLISVRIFAASWSGTKHEIGFFVVSLQNTRIDTFEFVVHKFYVRRPSGVNLSLYLSFPRSVRFTWAEIGTQKKKITNQAIHFTLRTVSFTTRYNFLVSICVDHNLDVSLYRQWIGPKSVRIMVSLSIPIVLLNVIWSGWFLDVIDENCTLNCNQ